MQPIQTLTRKERRIYERAKRDFYRAHPGAHLVDNIRIALADVAFMLKDPDIQKRMFMVFAVIVFFALVLKIGAMLDALPNEPYDLYPQLAPKG